MDTPTLPINVCEEIMNTLADAPLTQGFTAGEEQRTLCACALTCRAWRARAQFLLWRFPFLKLYPGFLILAKALDPMQRWLRDCTRGIALHSPTDDSNPGDYPHSIVNTLFTYTFPGLRLLHFSDVRFHVDPRIFRTRLPFFAHIVTLKLRFCTFDSARALLDVVWAITDLSSLEIESCHIRTALTTTTNARLSAACGHLYACAKLAELHFYDPTFLDPKMPIAGSVFGVNLKLLTIVISYAGDLITFLKGSFPRLHTITIMSRVNHEVPENSQEPSWLQALSDSLTYPSQLKRIKLVRKHRSSTNSCCHEIVGRGEAVNLCRGQSLRQLSLGLEELAIVFLECTNLETCAGYVHSVLPDFRDVLRLEWLDASGQDAPKMIFAH